jgi:peptidoglycan-associated lipoprotein
MKLIKLSVLLVLAVAMTVAATGCKKGPQKTTPLPGSITKTPGGETPALPPGGTFKPEGDSPGGGPTSDKWDPRDPNIRQDAGRFAKETVHFAFDSSAVKGTEQSKIATVAAAMQSEASLLLLIEGHCDERGTEEYNRSLGERRALALREELVKLNVNPDRIRTISYGEDKPAVSGHDESAWSQNRRGVFVACTPK